MWGHHNKITLYWSLFVWIPYLAFPMMVRRVTASLEMNQTSSLSDEATIATDLTLALPRPAPDFSSRGLLGSHTTLYYLCVCCDKLRTRMCVLLQTDDTCNTSCVCCYKLRTRATLHVCVVTKWGHVQHFISCWCCWCQPWWMSERELLSDNLIRHMSLESYQVNTNNQIFYWWCCRLWECSDKGLILMCLYISHIHKHVQMTVQLVN